MRRKISALVAGSLLFSALTVNIAGANELEQIEMREEQIQENQNVIQNQLQDIQSYESDINAAFAQIDELSQQRQVLTEEIDKLKEEIDGLTKSIQKNERDKAQLEKDLDDKVEIFKDRLSVMYKNRNMSSIDLLLEADNSADFLTRLRSMKTVANYDRDMIQEMNLLQEDLDLIITNLKGQKASRDQAYENLKFKEASLLDSIYDQQMLVEVLQSNKNLAESEVQRLNGVVDSLNAEIEDLNLQYQERLRREEEERRRIAEEKARQEEEARLAAERAAEEARLAEQSEIQSLAQESIFASNESEVSGQTEALNFDYQAAAAASFTPFTGEVTYFNQREEPWASHPYGTGRYSSIAANGCGPTSMAMVISSMTDSYTSPSEMADFATAGGHVMPGDGGSYWSLFPAAAQAYGLTCRQSSSPSEVNQALSNGSMVILSQNNALGGYWTIGGHFIVLTGIDENGYISVADPWSRAKSVIKHSQDQVYIPMKAAFIISGS